MLYHRVLEGQFATCLFSFLLIRLYHEHINTTDTWEDTINTDFNIAVPKKVSQLFLFVCFSFTIDPHCSLQRYIMRRQQKFYYAPQQEFFILTSIREMARSGVVH